MKINSFDTPCIGICSTIYGDEICRGCKRSSAEVIAWNGYSNQAKTAVLERLHTHITEVMAEVIQIENVMLLETQCQRYRVRYRQAFDPHTWAYLLLQTGLDQLKDLSACGLHVNLPFQHLSATALYTLIDKRLYQEACARNI